MGGKRKTHKIDYFFELTEIYGPIFGQKFLKWAESKFVARLMATFRNFEFGSKTKKLCNFKVRKCKIFKNSVYPHWK